MSEQRGWREAGCYVWRTRKPHAPIGLPFIGRHFAYGGETGSRYHRDLQHIRGGGSYSTLPKPWSDLDPKPYPLPCFFPNNRRFRQFQEKLYIRLLLPVYNVEHNKGNPRRITPRKAAQQRAERDAYGKITVVAHLALRWVIIGSVVGIAAYFLFGQGGVA